MTDLITSTQMYTFIWDILKWIGSALFLVLVYFVKKSRSDQIIQAETVRQLVYDMGSMKDATQANAKAIGDMIVSHGKALSIMREDQKTNNDEMKANQKETNTQLVKSFEMLIKYQILKSKNES